MPQSYKEYSGGELSATTYNVPFKYISINDVNVIGFDGAKWTPLALDASAPRSAANKTITLATVPNALYAKIRLYRATSTAQLVDFQNGSRLSESDLDTAYQQGLFVAQEVAEDADPEGGSGIGNVVNSQLAGGITQDKLAGGITNAQLAGSIADDKLASGVGTSANNLVKLDGTAKLPAVDGSQLTNVSGGGIMLQVKQVIIPKSSISNGTTNFVSTGHSLSITPSASTSRIMIEIRGGAGHCPYFNQAIIGTIYRDTTNLSTDGLESIGNSTSGLSFVPHNIAFLDSPNTTSQVTYTPYYKSSAAQADAYWNLAGGVGSDWSITLTELAP